MPEACSRWLSWLALAAAVAGLASPGSAGELLRATAGARRVRVHAS